MPWPAKFGKKGTYDARPLAWYLEIGDVISSQHVLSLPSAIPDCAHALTARQPTFSGIEKAVQLDGLGKMRLSIPILIRRGNNCNLIQIVLKAGKESVDCNKHTQ